MGFVVHTVNRTEFADAAQRIPSVVFFIGDVVHAGTDGEMLAEINIAGQVKQGICLAVLGKRPRIVQVVVAVYGIGGLFGGGAGQVTVDAPAFGRCIVTQAVTRSTAPVRLSGFPCHCSA